MGAAQGSLRNKGEEKLWIVGYHGYTFSHLLAGQIRKLSYRKEI